MAMKLKPIDTPARIQATGKPVKISATKLASIAMTRISLVASIARSFCPGPGPATRPATPRRAGRAYGRGAVGWAAGQPFVPIKTCDPQRPAACGSDISRNGTLSPDTGS